MRTRVAGILLGIASCWCGGCPEHPDQDQPPGVAASELISAVCHLTEPCCKRTGRGEGETGCRAGLETLLGRGGYDAHMAGECLAMLQGSEPEAICEILSSSSSPCAAALAPHYPGDRRPGESCAMNGDCAAAPGEDVICQTRGPGAGWCELRMRGQEGDGPCVGTVVETGTVSVPEPQGTRPAKAYLCHHDDNLQCDVEAGSRCKRPKAAGDSCRIDAECGRDAYCRTNVFTCRLLIPVGGACNRELACVDEAYCSLTTHLCTRFLTAGAACTADEACRSSVCDDGRCAPNLDPHEWQLFSQRFCADGERGDGGREP